MQGRLAGKVALVTAAGQGIGRAVAERLLAEGAEVHASDLDARLLDGLAAATGTAVDATDPAAVENCRRTWPQLDYADSPEDAAERADAVLLLTEWRQYRELDPVAFGRVVARRRVLDGRNALDRARWEAAGWSYRALGRRSG